MKHMEIREIKKELMKAIKYEDNATVAVKIYDCLESGEQTYDVEINWYLDDEYQDGWVSDIFYEGELPQAKKRASSVLRTVKNWFKYEDVEVQPKVEIYS
jgi:hypothetical protein